MPTTEVIHKRIAHYITTQEQNKTKKNRFYNNYVTQQK